MDELLLKQKETVQMVIITGLSLIVPPLNEIGLRSKIECDRLVRHYSKRFQGKILPFTWFITQRKRIIWRLPRSIEAGFRFLFPFLSHQRHHVTKLKSYTKKFVSNLENGRIKNRNRSGSFISWKLSENGPSRPPAVNIKNCIETENFPFQENWTI